MRCIALPFFPGPADFLDRSTFVMSFPSLFVQRLWTEFLLDFEAIRYQFPNERLFLRRKGCIRVMRPVTLAQFHPGWNLPRCVLHP